MVTGSASDTTTVYKGGELHIEVNAIGSWKASVLAQTDWFVAEDCKAFSALLPRPFLPDGTPFRLSPEAERERAVNLESVCVKLIDERTKEPRSWVQYSQAMGLVARPRSANDVEDMKREGFSAEAVLLWLVQETAYIKAAIATKEAAAKAAK
mgnify:CR=1 FL=1